MKKTILQSAVLESTSLVGADLSEASFSDTKAVGANFTNANLQHVDIFKTELSKAIFRNADLRNSTFVSMMTIGNDQGTVNSADFRGAKFEGADLYWVDFLNANLKDATYDAKTRLPVLFQKGEAEKRGMIRVP